MTNVNTRNLRPYKSFTILTLYEGVSNHEIKEAFVGCLETLYSDSETKKVSNISTQNGLSSFFVHQEQVTPVSWYVGSSLKDTLNHLAFAAWKDSLFCFHLSDSQSCAALLNLLLSEESPIFEDSLPSEQMIKKFLNGTVKTLWLTGSHKPSIFKSDKKVLFGKNLAHSLDPFRDQSFYFTSARSEGKWGVSPYKSRLWKGPTRESFKEFVDEVEKVIDTGLARDEIHVPLPVLCQAVSSDIASLNIDDIIVNVADFDLEGDEDKAILSLLEDIELEFDSRSVAEDHTSLIFKVSKLETYLGKLKCKLRASNNGWKIRFCKYTDEFEDRKLLIRGLNKFGVKIYFEDFQVLSDGKVFKNNLKSIEFDGMEFEKFEGVSIHREKPQYCESGEKSLFDWMDSFPLVNGKDLKTGLLICDDGTGEMADYLHISGGEIDLYHIKAAKSDSLNRKIAVAPFEVVTSQAVKNIRHLNLPTVISALKTKFKKKRMFQNGTECLGKDANWDNITLNKGRVIVVQPHIRKSVWESASNSDIRLSQLKTLLASAKQSANALDFEFVVIGHDDSEEEEQAAA